MKYKFAVGDRVIVLDLGIIAVIVGLRPFGTSWGKDEPVASYDIVFESNSMKAWIFETGLSPIVSLEDMERLRKNLITLYNRMMV